MPTKDQITDSLKAVIDPELRRSIVELGMVRSIEFKDEGRVEVVVSLTTPGCPIRAHFEKAVVEQVSGLEGVSSVGRPRVEDSASRTGTNSPLRLSRRTAR